ncbi:hypothetical protein GG344DRAFT_80812 [Lentinula edodes]|nr:hypothetical protein GG344DRAFT_80812 [Lentinula edodes]
MPSQKRKRHAPLESNHPKIRFVDIHVERMPDQGRYRIAAESIINFQQLNDTIEKLRLDWPEDSETLIAELQSFKEGFLMLWTEYKSAGNQASGVPNNNLRSTTPRQNFVTQPIESIEDLEEENRDLHAMQTHMTEKSLIETISAVNIELNTQRANVTKHSNELKKLQTINQDAVHLKKNMAQSIKVLEQRIKNMSEANQTLGNECKHQKEEISDLRARKDMLGKQVALLKKNIHNQGSIIKDAATERGLFKQNLHSVELEKLELKRLLKELKIKDTAVQAADRRSNQLKLKVQNLETLAETEKLKVDQELKAVQAKNHELENSLKMKIHQLMVYVKEIEVLKGREAETTSLYNTAMKDLKTFEQHNRELQLTIHHAKHIKTDEARQLNDIRAQYNDLTSMIRSAGFEAPQTSRKREVEPIGRMNEKTGDFCPYKEWERIQSSYQAVAQMKDQELQSKISEINSYKSAISGIEIVANDKLNSLQQQNEELQSIVTSQNIKVRYVEELAIQLKTFNSTNLFDLNLIHQVKPSTEYPQVHKFQELEGFMLEIQSILCSYKCKNDEELQAKDRELDNFKQWAETQINQRDSTLRDLQNLHDDVEQELCRFRGMQKAQVKELRTARKRVIEVLADDQDLDDRVQVKKQDLQTLTQEKADLETIIEEKNRGLAQREIELQTIRGISSAQEKDLHSTKQAFDEKENLIRILEDTLEAQDKELEVFKREAEINIKEKTRELAEAYAQSAELKDEWQKMKAELRLQNSDLDQIKRQQTELNSSLEILNNVLRARCRELDALQDEKRDVETILEGKITALIAGQRHFIDLNKELRRIQKVYTGGREALETTQKDPTRLQASGTVTSGKQVLGQYLEAQERGQANLEIEIQEKDTVLQTPQTLLMIPSADKTDLDDSKQVLSESKAFVRILEDMLETQSKQLEVLKQEKGTVIEENRQALVVIYELKDELRKIGAEHKQQDFELEQTKQRQADLTSSLETLHSVVHTRCPVLDGFKDEKSIAEAAEKSKTGGVVTARAGAPEKVKDLPRIQEEQSDLETTVVQHLANLSIDPRRSVIAEDPRHELDTSNNAKSSECQDQDHYRSSKFQGLVHGRRDKKYSVRHLLFLNNIILRYCANKVEKEQGTPRPGKSRQEKVSKSRFVALQNAYDQQTVECLVDNLLKPLLNASKTQLKETRECLSKEVYNYQNKSQRAMPKADTSNSESEKKLQTASDRNIVLQTQLLQLQSDIAQQESGSEKTFERQPDDGACPDISALEKRPALYGGLKKSFRGTDVKAKLARQKYA